MRMQRFRGSLAGDDDPGFLQLPLSEPPPDNSGFNWEQAVRILRKNIRFALVITVVLFAVVVSLALYMKDVYQPVARLEIVSMGGGIKTLQDAEDIQTTDQDYLETQSQILRSDALAISVIRELHLAANPEFVSKIFSQPLPAPLAGNPLRQSRDFSFLQEQLDLAEHTPEESAALESFRKKLTVSRIRNSRLVEVSFQGHDPRLAQLITNTLIMQFMDQNYRHRYASTMRASEWLSSQLNDLRQRVQEANQAVTDYQKKYNLVESDERDVPLAQLMNEVNHQLSDAQANRIEAEAYARMIDLGQSDAVPAVRDDQVYQNLMTKFADVRAQLAQARTIYGDENTNVKRLDNEANELSAQIEAERLRMVNQIRTSFAASRDRENMMSEARERLKAQMGDASSHMVAYRVLRNEALAKAELYNTLQARLKEAGIFAGLRSSNISVVDLASQLPRPTGPHRTMIIAAGGFFSLLAGIGFAFVRESFNNTVRTPDDVRNWTGLHPLGVLPKIASAPNRTSTNGFSTGSNGFKALTNGKGTLPRVVPVRSRTAEAEAMRYLRTALLLGKPDAPPRVILVSSSSASEGKTTVAINLAGVLALRGKTCLIESDLRRPTVAKSLGLETKLGLSQVLIGTASLDQALTKPASGPEMMVLASGPAVFDPEDLIESEHMKALFVTLRDKFDFLVIDSPPLIPFSDARVLSTFADGVVLVGRYGFTTRRAITRCSQILDEVGATVLGVVVNDINLESPDYHFYNYGYSRRVQKEYPYERQDTLPALDHREPDELIKKRSAHA